MRPRAWAERIEGKDEVRACLEGEQKITIRKCAHRLSLLTKFVVKCVRDFLRLSHRRRGCGGVSMRRVWETGLLGPWSSRGCIR